VEMVTHQIRDWRITENGSGELIVENMVNRSTTLRITPSTRDSSLDLTAGSGGAEFVVQPGKNGLAVVQVRRR
jgi:hypothetical protein